MGQRDFIFPTRVSSKFHTAWRRGTGKLLAIGHVESHWVGVGSNPGDGKNFFAPNTLSIFYLHLSCCISIDTGMRNVFIELRQQGPRKEKTEVVKSSHGPNGVQIPVKAHILLSHWLLYCCTTSLCCYRREAFLRISPSSSYMGFTVLFVLSFCSCCCCCCW